MNCNVLQSDQLIKYDSMFYFSSSLETQIIINTMILSNQKLNWWKQIFCDLRSLFLLASVSYHALYIWN